MNAGRYGSRRGLAVRPLGVFGPEIAAAALADRLFWDHSVGLSFAVFCVGLATAAHMTRPHRLRRRIAAALLILVFGLAPAVEHLGALSVGFALIATAGAAGLALPEMPSVPRASLEAILRWAAGPRRVCLDLDRRARWRRRPRAPRASRWTGCLAWLLPLTAGLVFMALFANANPIIADLLSDMPWPTFSLPALLPRMLFWLGVAVVVWPVMRPRRDRRGRARLAAVPARPGL